MAAASPAVIDDLRSPGLSIKESDGFDRWGGGVEGRWTAVLPKPPQT